MTARSFVRPRAATLWLLTLFLTLAVCTPTDADASRRRVAQSRGVVQVRSAILIDANTGRVLYEQNADRGIAPASLTKVASMYVAFDAISSGKLGLQDSVKVSRQAARQGGSRMFLKAGDRVSVDRLLFGMAISSGNDASMAVAEKVAGSSAAFVKLMNAKMRSLGLHNTVFKNVHGLPAKGQVTTARDMGKLALSYLRAYPKALRYHNAFALKHNGVTTTNKNPLLRRYKGADGLKTGWVNASGYNIITTAKRGNLRLLAVVLGAPDSNTRAREVRRLMDAGFIAAKKKTTVASILGLGRRAMMLADSGNDDTPEKKVTPRKSKNKDNTRVASSTSKKKENARASSSKSRKKENSRVASSSSKKKQEARSSRNKKRPAENASRQSADSSKSRKKTNGKTKWTAAGSLMDS